jgi:DNA-binding MarR family transcriptional regulator
MEKEIVLRKSAGSMFRGQPSEAVMNLSGFMAYKMSQYVQESFEVYFGETPVKARHFCVMRVLSADGPLSQQQLCDALWIDRATMVGVIVLLVDNDMVSKRTADGDKRSFIISLTTRGEKFYQKYREGFEKLDRKIFAGLSDAEIKQLRGLLRKAMSTLGAD